MLIKNSFQKCKNHDHSYHSPFIDQSYHSVLHINIHTMKHTVSDLFSNDMTFKFISAL